MENLGTILGKKKVGEEKLLTFDGIGLNPASVSATKKVLAWIIVIIEKEKKHNKYAHKAFIIDFIHSTNEAFNSQAASFQQVGLISLSLPQIHKRKQCL